jgi:hypothetical protein
MREVILWGGTDQARVLNERLFGSDSRTNFTSRYGYAFPFSLHSADPNLQSA